MKTILIPVDFSENTLVTCKYALQFAGHDKTRIFLFHIFPNQLMVADSSFPTGIDSDTFINAEFITELREQAEKNMLKLISTVQSMIVSNNQPNIVVEHLVSGGEPEYEVRQLCDELKPDLLIMGTRGEGKKGFLEGSMSEKLMNVASTPVIAVPETFTDIRINNIMYALNFSDYDLGCIRKVMELFKNHKKHLYIIHVELNDKKEEHKEMEALETSLRAVYPEEEFSFHVLNGADKTIALKDIVKVFQIDLISFIAHKSGFFKNLFSNDIHKKDFFKLELPLLALHEE